MKERVNTGSTPLAKPHCCYMSCVHGGMCHAIVSHSPQEKVVPEVSGPPTLQPATAAEDASEDDLYIKMKKLCRQLDFLQARQTMLMIISCHS